MLNKISRQLLAITRTTQPYYGRPFTFYLVHEPSPNAAQTNREVQLMSPGDFLKLPAYVAALVVVMFSPAIMAAAEFIVAFAGDLFRQERS